MADVSDIWKWQILLHLGGRASNTTKKYAGCKQVGLMQFATKKLADEAFGMFTAAGYAPVRLYGGVHDKTFA